MAAKLGNTLESKADPKIQLEQAISEAQTQHRKLKEQAANVIANQKQTEIKLDRAMDEYEKLTNNAQQAVMLADKAQKNGEAEKVLQYTTAAESFANRLIATEQEVEDLKALSLQSSEASDQAKAAVQQNSSLLQKKISEKQKLLSQLDQAKMQEKLNDAMEVLTEQVGQDVPTFTEVRDRIEQRYAKAKGTTELNEESVEGRMLEVEQASLNMEANNRLNEIRAQLGIDVVDSAEPAEVQQQQQQQ